MDSSSSEWASPSSQGAITAKDEEFLSCSRGLFERRMKPPPEQALKCPRCESTNTKFCYYNNYSLSQPRYFCKTCRRYWTKGGTLRTVPVGGGCRKNKKSSNSSSSKKIPASFNNNSSSSSGSGSASLPPTTSSAAETTLQQPLTQHQSEPSTSDGGSTASLGPYPNIYLPTAKESTPLEWAKFGRVFSLQQQHYPNYPNSGFLGVPSYATTTTTTTSSLQNPELNLLQSTTSFSGQPAMNMSPVKLPSFFGEPQHNNQAEHVEAPNLLGDLSASNSYWSDLGVYPSSSIVPPF
eukprot:TRINITY_DN6892_c0_g1_i2.p1 TRINITY_DN6892_c0_g1~~TRINITY_DN6892_c0_g1_i2.p1  ORF type:complete len:345 (+),score=28.89 TRINITY_DN6892_c0_g1_i2:155-1036(+)